MVLQVYKMRLKRSLKTTWRQGFRRHGPRLQFQALCASYYTYGACFFLYVSLEADAMSFSCACVKFIRPTFFRVWKPAQHGTDSVRCGPCTKAESSTLRRPSILEVVQLLLSCYPVHDVDMFYVSGDLKIGGDSAFDIAAEVFISCLPRHSS